jgi:hypothetical protein
MATLNAVRPVPMVRDVSASIRSYEGLGFRETFRDSPTAPRHAAVRRDGVELHRTTPVRDTARGARESHLRDPDRDGLRFYRGRRGA